MAYFVNYWDGLPGDGNTAFEEFASEGEAVAYINARLAELPVASRRDVTSPERCILIEGRALDLELIGDADVVRVRPGGGVRLTTVAAEDIPIGSLIMLSDDKQSVRRLWPASGLSDGIAMDPIANGERAYYYELIGHLRKMP